MLRTFDEIVPAIRRRFERTWADVACGIVSDTWPHAFGLGRPSQTELSRNARELIDEIDALRLACDRYGCILKTESRRLGAVQKVPSHIVVPDADVAAALLGTDEERRLTRARNRAGQLSALFPLLPAEDMSVVLRRIDAWSDVDAELLFSASRWFVDNDAQGLTPRQVPLDGFHAKWLDTAGRQALVRLLSGKVELGLAKRPREIALSYLDPTWLQAGGRHYDVCVEGDVWQPAYDPRVILIVENKDSYLMFPRIDGGVCIFGAGKSGPAVCVGCNWITQTPQLFYWGDMDADGLEILNAYRTAGLAVESILMDVETFDRYERFGTRMASGKRHLDQHVQAETPMLLPQEQNLYERLCSESWKGALRIEQERIPLNAAVEELCRKLAAKQNRC